MVGRRVWWGVSERMKGSRGGKRLDALREPGKKKRGEGKALTSCGNTHFSHELIQSRKVTFSKANAHPKKGSSQCRPCLKEPLLWELKDASNARRCQKKKKKYSLRSSNTNSGQCWTRSWPGARLSEYRGHQSRSLSSSSWCITDQYTVLLITLLSSRATAPRK